MKKEVRIFLYLLMCTLLLSYYSNSISMHNIPEPAGAVQGMEEETDLDNLAIYVKNQSGELVIQDELAAINLINILRDDKRIVKTKATCPFENEIVIRKDNEEIEKFKIAADGCFVALRENHKIIKLPESLYRELEEYMKMGDNSFYSTKKK